MANKTPFSQHGLAFGAAVDVPSLSDRAAYVVETRRLIITTAAGQKQTAVFAQNTTTKHNLGPVGGYRTLKAAWISAETAPVGGTLTWSVVAYDKSGTAEVVLTDTSTDPESVTVRTGQAQVLATTNVALDPDDTVELHCVASNATVSQDAQGVTVALQWLPTEADPPTSSQRT